MRNNELGFLLSIKMFENLFWLPSIYVNCKKLTFIDSDPNSTFDFYWFLPQFYSWHLLTFTPILYLILNDIDFNSTSDLYCHLLQFCTWHLFYLYWNLPKFYIWPLLILTQILQLTIIDLYFNSTGDLYWQLTRSAVDLYWPSFYPYANSTVDLYWSLPRFYI